MDKHLCNSNVEKPFSKHDRKPTKFYYIKPKLKLKKKKSMAKTT